jgi:hypothetical protein
MESFTDRLAVVQRVVLVAAVPQLDVKIAVTAKMEIAPVVVACRILLVE